MNRMMSFGLSMRYLGYHAASWRHPDANPRGGMQFAHFAEVARKAEAAGFDMLFLADGIGIRAVDSPVGALAQTAQTADLEPMTLLSALAAVTTNIGLVATASTTYNEPFHVARKYASLDRISGGRAGWNIVTSWSEAEAWNFGRDTHLGYAERYERAYEFADVVEGLWHSWGKDAIVADKKTGIFLDTSRLHVLNHKGPHFRVRGPLDVPPSPQGHPVMVQAGASDAGIELAARKAEVVYALPHDLQMAESYSCRLRGALEQHGRNPRSIRILAGITPYIGATMAEAQEKYDAMNALIPPELGLSYLYAQLGDLSAFPLDGPVPDPVDPRVRSIAQGLITMARSRNMTIRQLYNFIAAGFGSRVVIGTPESIVDEMQEWFETGFVDGFNLCPALLPMDIDSFSNHILPELRRRGLARTGYAGSTLRENLGLPMPGCCYPA
ncbi:LLM class flavin-dependent oxidoreductase [Komagataeibacter xylinus]|uniref:LLM class flavin-dependent oxidoreductase n=1 Tax=Komagataeibacter xylinus TaxID=28448 RepID=UPI00280B2EC7|nr:LLM class flavin-dependent oxidoreductase [Komagataeibacter xylinus]